MTDPSVGVLVAASEPRFGIAPLALELEQKRAAGEAHAGFLFRPPARVSAEFAQFAVTRTYEELRSAIRHASATL
jgi:hypothetical protein